jgi:hypothetical protein
MCDGIIHYDVEPMKEFYPNLDTSPSKVTWVGVTGGQDAMEKEGLNSQFCIGSLSVRMILIISGGDWIVYHYNGQVVDIFPG